MQQSEAEKNISKYLETNKNFKSIDSVLEKMINFYNNWHNVFDYDNGKNIVKLVLYSEIILKFRSAFLLFKNGFSFEAVGILRSALEINHKFFGIRKDLFTLEEALGRPITEEFENMNFKEKYKHMHNYSSQLNSKVKNEIFKTLSEEEKNIYKDFEYAFNSSLHNGSMGVSNRLFALKENFSLHNLFYPEFDERFMGIFINTNYYLILITLKNTVSEIFYLKNEELENMIKQVVKSYVDLELKPETELPKKIVKLINRIY